MRIVADQVQLTVPATSANLGAGFDTLGIALELRDRVTVRAVAGPTRVIVRGEGTGRLPDGEDHLVVRAIRVGLEYCGAPQVGLAVTCHNSIPHSRGLGSSAAAAVVGLAAARALISEPESLDDASLLQLATDFEGHPDNAAPALFGGATLAWMDEGKAGWTRSRSRTSSPRWSLCRPPSPPPPAPEPRCPAACPTRTPSTTCSAPPS